MLPPPKNGGFPPFFTNTPIGGTGEDGDISKGVAKSTTGAVAELKKPPTRLGWGLVKLADHESFAKIHTICRSGRAGGEP